MASWRELACASGVALEAAAVAALMHDMGALALAAHLGSCGGMAVGLGRRLSAGIATRRLAFAMALFVPGLAMLGWVAAALSRPAPGNPGGSALVRTPVPGPEAARVLTGRTLAPPGGGPTSARAMAARSRDDPDAIALLRRTLADGDEDARLVAHAVLESKLRIAYRTIHEATCELETAASERRAHIHRRLAAEHWELVRVGLADGECLVHALESARHHARAALADDPGHASSWLLLGRIELRRDKPEDAEVALARAAEGGLRPAIVEPYLIEAAFLERRFDRVRQRLAIEPAGGNPALDRIRSFWS